MIRTANRMASFILKSQSLYKRDRSLTVGDACPYDAIYYSYCKGGVCAHIKPSPAGKVADVWMYFGILIIKSRLTDEEILNGILISNQLAYT